jgi:hypothetical protein
LVCSIPDDEITEKLSAYRAELQAKFAAQQVAAAVQPDK